jgi:N-acyl-D-amino-acid deacylase
VPADGLLISAFKPDPSLVGKTIAQIAVQRGTDPAQTLMDMIREDGGAKSEAGVIGTSMDEGDVKALIQWSQSNIVSDGAIDDLHPRGIGSFPRILGRYVREQHALTLEEAVRKMSGLAAAHMGLVDRGVIRPGAYADLVLFDPATVADRATTQHPDLMSVGIEKVWVNGVLVCDDDHATGARPGRVLRRSVKGN